MNDARMDRREFVTACAGCGAALLLAGCATMVTHAVPVRDDRMRLRLSQYPDLARPEGAIKILPEGAEDPIYVLAGSDGFTAVSPVCTHRGCTVEVSGARLVCPCHGSTYDRAGKVLRGPAQRALTRYAVTRDGDDLVIEVRPS